jgi:hypothetical protein
MTEPVSPHNNASEGKTQNSKALEDIIDSLEKYKSSIVNDYTLKTQDPKSLAKLPNILSNRGKDLKLYFRTNNSSPNAPNLLNQDPLFTEVKNSLEPYRNSITPELLTLVPYYIDHLFINSPSSTLTVSHLNTLKRNAAAYNPEY